AGWKVTLILAFSPFLTALIAVLAVEAILIDSFTLPALVGGRRGVPMVAAFFLPFLFLVPTVAVPVSRPAFATLIVRSIVLPLLATFVLRIVNWFVRVGPG